MADPLAAPVIPNVIASQSNTPWYLDKALWLTVLGVVLPVVSSMVGIQMDPAKVAGIIIPIVAFVIAHKAKSGAILVAEIKTRAAAEIAATPVVRTPAAASAALNDILLGKT